MLVVFLVPSGYQRRVLRGGLSGIDRRIEVEQIVGGAQRGLRGQLSFAAAIRLLCRTSPHC
jgi:hypothetical protein